MMALKLITAPAVEPLTTDEVRLFLRIDSDPGDDDDILRAMITTARQKAEAITRRQLITAVWELRLDRFPVGNCKDDPGTIYLPMPPLQSVSPVAPAILGGVSYLDAQGTEQDLVENTDYLVDIYAEPGRITPNYGMVWPPIYPVPGAVRVVYKAGYGDAATAIPMAIRNWMKAFIGALWENRETVVVSPTTLTQVNVGFLDGLLDEYRVFGLE